MARQLFLACLLTFGIESAFAAVPHIWNGTEVQPHKFPWLIAVHKGIEENSSYSYDVVCGGVLLAMNKDDIQSDIVLTAAHCITKCVGPDVRGCVFRKPSGDPNPKHIYIVAGDHYQFKKDNGEKRVNVSAYEWHSSWAGGGRINDIGVIKLLEPLVFTKTIRPAYLPKSDEVIKDPKKCTLAGWGDISDHKDRTIAESEVLRYVNISKILTGEECSVYNYYRPKSELDAVFCAVAETQIATGCPGDSGSPLWCSSQDGPLIYGLVSGGKKLCNSGSPLTYVNVPHYVKWIEDTIARLNGAIRD